MAERRVGPAVPYLDGLDWEQATENEIGAAVRGWGAVIWALLGAYIEAKLRLAGREAVDIKVTGR